MIKLDVAVARRCRINLLPAMGSPLQLKKRKVRFNQFNNFVYKVLARASAKD
jgi:hypothetical protein